MRPKIFTRGSGKDHGLGLFHSRETQAITGISIEENGALGEWARFELGFTQKGPRAT